jgi:WD40 repeat protein
MMRSALAILLAISFTMLLTASSAYETNLKGRKLRLLRTYPSPEVLVSSMAFSPNGEILAVGTNFNGKGLFLLRIDDGTILRTITDIKWVKSIAFSPDGKTVAAGGDPIGKSTGSKIWRIDDGSIVFSNNEPGPVAFSPDGKVFAIAGKGIGLYRAQNGELLRTLTAGENYFESSIAFGPDGTTLVTGGYDSHVRLWRINDGKLLLSLSGHAANVFSVAFNPDGKTIASTSYDGYINLWRVQDGKLLHTLDNAIITVRNNRGDKSMEQLFADMHSLIYIAFSPDGKVLAACNHWGNLGLWDAEYGGSLASVDTSIESKSVQAISFAPDGKTIAVGYQNISLWSVSP